MEKSGILSASGVTDMGQTLAHNGDDMVVIQAVKDAFALPAGLDQVGIAQQPELMGHRRLGHAQGLGEVIDAQFLFQQGGNNAQTAVVRKDLEHFAEPFQFRVGGHLAEDRPGFRQGRYRHGSSFLYKRVRLQTVPDGCGNSGTDTAGQCPHRAAVPPGVPGGT